MGKLKLKLLNDFSKIIQLAGILSIKCQIWKQALISTTTHSVISLKERDQQHVF